MVRVRLIVGRPSTTVNDLSSWNLPSSRHFSMNYAPTLQGLELL